MASNSSKFDNCLQDECFQPLESVVLLKGSMLRLEKALLQKLEMGLLLPLLLRTLHLIHYPKADKDIENLRGLLLLVYLPI
nr:hypothetical protein [Tanacetum cinerariifolium]